MLFPKERRAVIEDSHEPVIDSLASEQTLSYQDGNHQYPLGAALLSRLRCKAELGCIKRIPDTSVAAATSVTVPEGLQYPIYL